MFKRLPSKHWKNVSHCLEMLSVMHFSPFLVVLGPRAVLASDTTPLGAEGVAAGARGPARLRRWAVAGGTAGGTGSASAVGGHKV